MKKIFTLFLFVVCMSALSQPYRPGSHVVLIRNLHTSRIYEISNNSSISIETNSGSQVFGWVRSISKDTIFFKDTLVKLSDIDKIFPQPRVAFSHHPLHDVSRPLYIKSGNDYKLIVPPDSVYKNLLTYKIYLQNLHKQDKQNIFSESEPLVTNNFIKLNLVKLLHLELGVSYERVISKKFSWEVEFSGMLGVPSSGILTNVYPLFNYSGISITAYPKYYFSPKAYVSVVLMYRYLWVKGMTSAWPDQNEISGSYFTDQYRNDFGLSLRIGIMKRYGKWIVDYYFGAGVKYIALKQLIYGQYEEDSSYLIWNNENHTPTLVYKELFGPVINFGIKIGKAF